MTKDLVSIFFWMPLRSAPGVCAGRRNESDMMLNKRAACTLLSLPTPIPPVVREMGPSQASPGVSEVGTPPRRSLGQ